MSLLRNVFQRKLLLALIAFVVLVVLLISFLLPREPTYQGKTASQWLEIRFENSSATPSDRKNAREAIRQMGSNAVPILLKKLVTGDSDTHPIATFWNYVARSLSLPSKLHVKIPIAFLERQRAMDGFEIIGTNGSPAVPTLKGLFLNRRTTDDATWCLKFIQTSEALSALASGLTNADPIIRANAIGGMTWFDDEDLKPFSASIKACVDDPDENVAYMAIRSLYRILPDTEFVPILLPKLKDHRTQIQRATLLELSKGPETSMPAIAECFSSTDVTNRKLATNVLLILNPFRASEFGVVTNHLRRSIFDNWLGRRSQTNSPK